MEEKEPFCRIRVYRNELDLITSHKKLLVLGEKAMKKTKKP
jgi:hypothetical protein